MNRRVAGCRNSRNLSLGWSYVKLPSETNGLVGEQLVVGIAQVDTAVEDKDYVSDFVPAHYKKEIQ